MELLDQLFRLSGKMAMVTGGGSGIGQVIAEGLATVGAHVVCADVHLDRALEVADGIRSRSGSADAVQVDVSDESSVGQAIGSIGPNLDILVNSAGISSPPARTHEVAIGDWRRVIDVNLTGTFLVTRAALPKMLARGGSIINISSIMGLGGYYPGFPSNSAEYTASKAGVVGFTQQVAVEYAADNIRCNVIAPGWHGGSRLGEARKKSASPEQEARFFGEIEKRIPMQRRGHVRELLGLALYLASPASGYVTGQLMTQDGGWSAC